MKNHREEKLSKAGFTLIEALIYLALLLLIIGGMLVSVYQIIQASNGSNSKLVINDEANFILRKLNWALTGTSAIVSPGAGFAGTTLVVTRFSSPTSLTFDLNSGNLRLKRGAGTFAELNSRNVVVASLSFQHLAAVGGKPEAVKTDFKLNGRPFELIKYLR